MENIFFIIILAGKPKKILNFKMIKCLYFQTRKLKLRETQCLVQNFAEGPLLSEESWLTKSQQSSCTQCMYSVYIQCRHQHIYFTAIHMYKVMPSFICEESLVKSRVAIPIQ